MIKYKAITFKTAEEYSEWAMDTTAESHPIVDTIYHTEETGGCEMITVVFSVKVKAPINYSKAWKKLNNRDDVQQNKLSIDFLDVNNKSNSAVKVLMVNKEIELCDSYLKAVRLVNKICKESLAKGIRYTFNKYYHNDYKQMEQWEKEGVI